jgi:uncharacterized membrane protein YgdD (TMEM256/DUF423 family)
MILALGALLGFISVAFGAYAEHGLRAQVSEEIFRFVMTAIRYNQLHALVITAIGLAGLNAGFFEAHRWLFFAALGFILGTALFSFSIYLSAILQKPELTRITPIGGMTLMASWLMLAWAGVKTL